MSVGAHVIVPLLLRGPVENPLTSDYFIFKLLLSPALPTPLVASLASISWQILCCLRYAYAIALSADRLPAKSRYTGTSLGFFVRWLLPETVKLALGDCYCIYLHASSACCCWLPPDSTSISNVKTLLLSPGLLHCLECFRLGLGSCCPFRCRDALRFPLSCT